MAIASPVTQRSTVVALLLLTCATGIVDAVSVLVLGHVFVANMTSNVAFLGFSLVEPHHFSMGQSATAIAAFMVGAVIGGDHVIGIQCSANAGADRFGTVGAMKFAGQRAIGEGKNGGFADPVERDHRIIKGAAAHHLAVHVLPQGGCGRHDDPR